MEHYPKQDADGEEKPIAAIDQLIDIHHFTPIGAIYASGAFASLLALDTVRYKLSFIDTLREVDKRAIRPIDVFSVALLYLSKLSSH